jgi:translation initiation factor 2B subunit (eIF-2B alpha/beta/delta family)
LPQVRAGNENAPMEVLAHRVEELRSQSEHGASWMARRAVEALLDVASEEAATSEELVERLVAAGRELASSRPGVGAIAGAVGRLVASARSGAQLPPGELRRLLEAHAEGMLGSRDRAKRSIAIQLRERLADALVVTHSASATVREALVYTPPAFVTCTATAPHEEGRVLAEELREAGLEVEVVSDDEAEAALERSSLLLLGADTVFADGAVCNRAGTRGLAEAAARFGVPTVVAAEAIKLTPVAAAEAPALGAETAAGFDLTPAHLVDEIVTEEGTVRPDGVRPLVDRTPFLAEGYALLHGAG